MRIYLIIGAVVAVLGAFSGLLIMTYQAGKQAERASHLAQIEEYRASQRFLLDKLSEEQAKERIVYKTKVRTIREATGDCLDTAIPAPIINELR